MSRPANEPAGPPPGRPATIHVHEVWLDGLPQRTEVLRRWMRWLPEDEVARADRFRVEQARAAFVAGRALLRMRLGAALRRDGRSLTLGYGPHGRPFLQETPSNLGFNLAHTDGLIVLALGPYADLGVDVEHRGRSTDLEAIAAESLSAQEHRVWLKLADPSDRRRRFFELWTLKEAYLKARGLGISAGLRNLDFTRNADGIEFDATRDLEPSPKSWRFLLHEPGRDHQLALAVRMPEAATPSVVFVDDTQAMLTRADDATPPAY